MSQEDRMESFFLSETLKYLYLVSFPAHSVPAEAHLSHSFRYDTLFAKTIVDFSC